MSPAVISRYLARFFKKNPPVLPSFPPGPWFEVHFETPAGERFPVEALEGSTLLTASSRGRANMPTGCVDGSCGLCRVEILEGHDQLSPPTEEESRLASARGWPREMRLACQARVLGPGVRVRMVNVVGAPKAA